MKRLTNLPTCLVMMLFIIGVTDVTAQHTYKFSDSLGTYTVKFRPHVPDTQFALSPTKPLLPNTHELRLSTSWGATNSWGGVISWNENIGRYYTTQSDYYKYDYSDSHYYTINLDYVYWAKEWLSVGVSATWVMGLRNLYDSQTRKRVDTQHQDFISIMPTVRFAWLRRGVVQLYSSFSLGLGVEHYLLNSDVGRPIYNTLYYCAFDIKPVGVSVGRKWFGFAELGYGSRGVFNIGFGCRINSNMK